MPPSPRGPLPRSNRIITVSAWSSRVCAVATLSSGPSVSISDAKKECRKCRPASSRLIFRSRAYAVVSADAANSSRPYSAAMPATNSASPRDSFPRILWSKCAAARTNPSSCRSSSSSRSSATESAPPEIATPTRSPARTNPSARMCARSCCASLECFFKPLPLPNCHSERSEESALKKISLPHPQVVPSLPHRLKIPLKISDLLWIIREPSIIVLHLLACLRPVRAAVAQQPLVNLVRLQVHQIATRARLHAQLDSALAAQHFVDCFVPIFQRITLFLFILLAIAINAHMPSPPCQPDHLIRQRPVGERIHRDVQLLLRACQTVQVNRLQILARGKMIFGDDLPRCCELDLVGLSSSLLLQITRNSCQPQQHQEQPQIPPTAGHQRFLPRRKCSQPSRFNSS